MINPAPSSWAYPSVPPSSAIRSPGAPVLDPVAFLRVVSIETMGNHPRRCPGSHSAPDQYPLIHSLSWLPFLMLLALLCDSWTLYSLPRTICDSPSLFQQLGSLAIHPGRFIKLGGSDKFQVHFPHIFLHISVGDDYTNLLPNSWLADWHGSSRITRSSPCMPPALPTPSPASTTSLSHPERPKCPNVPTQH
jgi:hypothetical protein